MTAPREGLPAEVVAALDAQAAQDARAVVEETTAGAAALETLVTYLQGAQGVLHGLEPLQAGLLGGVATGWGAALLTERLAQASAEAARLSAALARLSAEAVREELEAEWGSPYRRADGRPVESA